MNKQFALLALVTITLAACASAPKQGMKAAPVEDLNPATSTKAPQPEKETPAVATESTAPQSGSGGYLPGDGPGADAPKNLDDIPDAVPKPEPLHRYANREYTALGKTYKPLTVTGAYKETGIASWYGKKFHGQRTSIGEVYDMYGMTAAHPTLPIPSYARVTNLSNKRSVIVRINDRGPFLHDRIIDLSYTAAYKLRLIDNGSAEVEVESIATDSSSPAVVATALPASAPVQAEPMAAAEPTPPVVVVPEAKPKAAEPAAGKYYLQLGAFKSPEGAASFLAKMRSKLGEVDKPLALYKKDGLQRIHLGPYATEAEARASGERLKARLGFKPYLSVR